MTDTMIMQSVIMDIVSSEEERSMRTERKQRYLDRLRRGKEFRDREIVSVTLSSNEWDLVASGVLGFVWRGKSADWIQAEKREPLPVLIRKIVEQEEIDPVEVRDRAKRLLELR